VLGASILYQTRKVSGVVLDNSAYFSGLVKNRCTYHTNTTLLTFPASYRIDAPNTPIQLRLLFWLRKESMHQTHQYNAVYFSGLVKNRCTYHTNTTLLTFPTWYRIDAPNTPIQLRLLFWVVGASILYQARKVNGVVLVCLVHRFFTQPEK
jgi:hypothetical protein